MHKGPDSSARTAHSPEDEDRVPSSSAFLWCLVHSSCLFGRMGLVSQATVPKTQQAGPGTEFVPCVPYMLLLERSELEDVQYMF